MTSSSLISNRNNAEKPERLFRSAISAYCALVRPSRRDAEQFDDLTLPLLPLVSTEGRRYAAAALSEMGPQPTALLRRLAEETLDISAPLLTRSVNLSDVDLIGLIGRHGIGHAKAISRRANLNSNIAKLITALGATNTVLADAGDVETTQPEAAPVVQEQVQAGPAADQPIDAAEDVRVQLREMMRPARPAQAAPAAPALDWSTASAAYSRLLSSALTGSDAFFHTALADALNIGFGTARMLDDDDAPGLTAVLKALDLSVEQAFLVAVLAYPYGLVGHDSVRGFVESYRRLELNAARDEVNAWRERDAGRRAVLSREWEPVAAEPANDADNVRVLKAS
ncbi:MAG: hypothetical protein WDZ83_09450 [Rhizobiaceae bacterium]